MLNSILVVVVAGIEHRSLVGKLGLDCTLVVVQIVAVVGSFVVA